MSLSASDVVEYIKNLKLSEVKNLVTQLEQELGVKAGAPVMMGAAAPAAAAAAPVVEEKTEFNVILTGVPDATKKISVIKAVRALTSLGLREAKEAVEGAPTTIREAVNKEEAESARKQLEEAGGEVKID
ncbi:MAG: 50S ribosomal protein L7/L12 [Deltaproteobacteria bacterium]|nr:50S ribosomal protein L7/L12 [Deltaproteobacteria bacterium]